MTSFHSNNEFFRAAGDLIARLEEGGHEQVATTLREGLQSMNGLTDGWALLLQAIEKAQQRASPALLPTHRHALESLRLAAHSAVYRR
jgi:hypothetical protein